VDWGTYSHLAESANQDQDYLVGLSMDDLNALASCKLALTSKSLAVTTPSLQGLRRQKQGCSADDER
jgi:hypothetical protein